jgi:hypothetical protein
VLSVRSAVLVYRTGFRFRRRWVVFLFGGSLRPWRQLREGGRLWREREPGGLTYPGAVRSPCPRLERAAPNGSGSRQGIGQTTDGQFFFLPLWTVVVVVFHVPQSMFHAGPPRHIHPYWPPPRTRQRYSECVCAVCACGCECVCVDASTWISSMARISPPLAPTCIQDPQLVYELPKLAEPVHFLGHQPRQHEAGVGHVPVREAATLDDIPGSIDQEPCRH